MEFSTPIKNDVEPVWFNDSTIDAINERTWVRTERGEAEGGGEYGYPKSFFKFVDA